MSLVVVQVCEASGLPKTILFHMILCNELISQQSFPISVSTKTACTLFRVDRRTFRFFLGMQQPQEVEDVKDELRIIDSVIDKVRLD